MSNRDLAATLSTTSLFQSLSRTNLEQLLQTHYFPISRYQQGQRVAFRGDPYEELCIILRGALQAEINDIEGHTLTVETLAAPQVVASSVFFSSNRCFPVDLVAKSDVQLLRISRTEVYSLLRENEAVLQGLLTDMGDRLQFLAQRLRMNQFGSIRQKLAVYLMDSCSGSSGSETTIRNSRQELADIFGVARPSVSRVLSELEHEGVIRVHGRRVEILDFGTLTDLAQDVAREE